MTRPVFLLSFLICLCAGTLFLCAGACSAGSIHEGGPAVALSDDDKKKVMEAVDSGSLAKLKALIEKNPSLAKEPIGMLRAVIGNRIDMVEYLLSKGADINAEPNPNENVLMVSCRLGDENIKMTKYLLAHGVSLDKKDHRGNSVLVYAIRGCFQSIEAGEKSPPPFETIRLILSKGVPANSKNNEGVTPLMSEIIGWAGCFGCNPAVVKLLIEKGADVNAADNKGKTAIDYARESRKMADSRADLKKRVDDCVALIRKAGAKK